MRRLLVPLSVVAAALGVAVWFGPRVRVKPPAQPPAVPADLGALEAALAAGEAAVPGIRPGTEKCIVWADPAAPARTALSVVYLHGFSATRQETAPLSDTVAARLGANLYYPRLAGHGRDADALGAATADAWLRDAQEALEVGRRLGERVVLVGTSTGGTLATWLAATQDAGDLAALVLLSPNFMPRDPNAPMLLWPWGRRLARAVVGPYRSFEPHSPAQERYWTTRYGTDAVVEMMGLVQLVDDLDLADVGVPTLVVYSPDDEVISPAAVERAYQELGAAHKALVPVIDPRIPSSHVLAGDVLAPHMTAPLADTIATFLERLAPTNGAPRHP